MNSRFLLLLPLALVGLVVVYFSRSNSEDGMDTAGGLSPVEELTSPGVAGNSEPGQLAIPEGVGTRREREAVASTEVDWREIEVSLLLPIGAPADPQLSIVAVQAEGLGGDAGSEFLQRMRDDEELGLARERIVPGQKLRMSVPGGVEIALLVDGKFLYLEESVKVSVEMQSVSLAPVLGACLVVRMGSPDEALAGEVSVTGASFGGGRRGGERRKGDASLDEPLVFRALNADLNWSVLPSFDEHYAASTVGLELEPGEERIVEVLVSLGGVVEGQVLDETGTPVAAVKVSTAASPMAWMGGSSARETNTDADGRFRLMAIEPGEQVLELTAEGWRDGESEEFVIEDGQEIRGMLLKIDRGDAIRGFVRWSDGTPAAGASVVAEGRGSAGWGGWGGSRIERVGDTESAQDGSFAFVGLDPGSYTLRASSSSRTGAEVDGALWRADQEAVETKRTAVLLELLGPLTISGRVLDDLGQPVPSFKLTVKSVQDGGPQESQEFEDAEGLFDFARVGPGEWTIEALADGFIQVEPKVLQLTTDVQELELKLERTALLAGRVLDPSGAPIAGARVQASVGSGQGNTWRGPSGPSDETDVEGRFRIENLRPGTATLSASSEGWADSEDLSYPLSPGMEVEDAVLALRIGGRIVGTVLTPEGDGIPSQRVTWGSNAMGFGSRGDTRTDAAGAFSFENVTPGDWAVSAAPSMEEMGKRMQGRRGSSAFTEVMGQLVTETVTVVDRGVVEVNLGGEPRRPVRIFGTVTLAGEPVVDARVVAVSEASAVFEGMKSAETDFEGKYELVIDRPGPHTISATSGSLGVAFQTEVPSEDEVRVDLSIPRGRIIGMVRKEEGRPAAGVRLSIEREDGLGRMRWGGDRATTDESGRYALESLEPGRYTVRANVSSWGGRADADLGTIVQGGIRVEEDQTVDDVDFRLEKGGSLKGVVVGPDGQPVSGASVFFRDSAGRLLSNVSGTTSNVAGEFRRDGLAPGDYELSLRSAGLASSRAASASISSDQTTEVRLTLEVGTTLVVTLAEDGESLQRARYEVFDADDREVGGLMTLEQMRSTFNEGGQSSERRIGPLPSGRYTVRATLADGRTTERSVKLSGRLNEKRVRLKMDS